MKKVLFVAHNHPALQPGGAEGHALDLHEALEEGGRYEPIFLARAERTPQRHTRIPIGSVDGRKGHYLMYTEWNNWDFMYGRSSDRSVATRFFRDFLLGQRPDVIHFQHTRFLGYDMLRVARNTLPDVPLLYTLHDYLPICHRSGQMVRTNANELCQEESPRRCHECFPEITAQAFYVRKRFIQSHLSLIDLFIAPSEYVRDMYAEWGIPAERIQVVPYARAPVGVAPDVPVERPRNRFAFFGQFTPFKGVDVLLRAMASLGDKFNGHLWIHAANLEFQPQEFQDEISDLLEQTKQTVTDAGPYEPEELPGLLEKIDWVIVPSIWWETGPLVVLEAFQHGRPVIASDIGGMAEKVEEGVSGLHFRTGDSDSLAEVIAGAAHTPGLWDRLHAGIPPVYDIRDHASHMSDVYDDLITERTEQSLTAPSLPRYLPADRSAEPVDAQVSVEPKPKVLYVSMNHPNVRPGGAEGFALDLYHAIRDKGDFEPIFLARSGPPLSSLVRYHWGTPLTAVNDDPNQYLLYTDPQHWDYLFQRSADKQMLVRFYREFLLEQEPDVVHFQHTMFLGHDMLRVTRNTLPDTPILYMLHEYMPICHRDGQMVRTKGNQLCTHESPRRCNECFPTVPPEMFYMRKRFIQSQLSLVDLFIAPSEHVRDEYVKWGIPAEKIRVEPYACRPVPDPPGPGPDPNRSRNRFAFFGQFTPYKGADVLLEAMRLLGEGFDGQLSIHGANLDRQPKAFREQFKELLDAVPSTVTFAGPYDHDRELSQLMARTDWVIVPSIWWETGPLVVLEAFLHGRPVICSDIGGMSEKVADGVSGLHFRRADPESLAATIRHAAETPSLWDELRAGIPAVYDIADHASAMNDVYKNLLAARHAERDRLVSVS